MTEGASSLLLDPQWNIRQNIHKALIHNMWRYEKEQLPSNSLFLCFRQKNNNNYQQVCSDQASFSRQKHHCFITWDSRSQCRIWKPNAVFKLVLTVCHCKTNEHKLREALQERWRLACVRCIFVCVHDQNLQEQAATQWVKILQHGQKPHNMNGDAPFKVTTGKFT